MNLPQSIPSGIRVVVRVIDGTDPYSGRPQYRDFVGHVRAWDGKTLRMRRDASANGARPEEDVAIDADRIVRMKPVPERRAERPGWEGKR